MFEDHSLECNLHIYLHIKNMFPVRTLTDLRKEVETGVKPRLGSWFDSVHYDQVDRIEINSTWLLCTLFIIFGSY